MNYNIALIPGDGIGPEIVAEARKVLDDSLQKNTDISFTYTEATYWAEHPLMYMEYRLQMRPSRLQRAATQC